MDTNGPPTPEAPARRGREYRPAELRAALRCGWGSVAGRDGNQPKPRPDGGRLCVVAEAFADQIGRILDRSLDRSREIARAATLR
jgi:hypothetical protein